MSPSMPTATNGRNSRSMIFGAATKAQIGRLGTGDVVLPVSHGAARILVVEVENGILNALNSTLSKAGYDIQTATCGDEAKLIYEADQSFDLLLTDIVMPSVLQGTLLAKALREQHPNLRVVLRSGYASEATVPGNGLRPQDFWLMTPVGRADLIKAIEKAIGYRDSLVAHPPKCRKPVDLIQTFQIDHG